MEFYFFFIKRTVSTKRKRLSHVISATIGVILSVAPMIMLFMIADSIIEGISSRLLETSSYHLQLRSFLPDDTGMIEKLEEIKSTTPEVIDYYIEKNSYAMAVSRDSQMAVNVRAIEDKLLEPRSNFAKYFEVDGDFGSIGKGEIVLGKEVAKTLGVKVGDPVRLITSKDGGSENIKISPFVVKAIVSVGYQDLDKMWVFTSYEDATYLNEQNSQTIYGMKLINPYIVPNELSTSGINDVFYSSLLEKSRGFRLFNWYELEYSKYTNFVESRDLIAIVLVVVLLVAIINLVSSMSMFIIERETEISFMRCLGMSRFKIGFLFFLLSSFIAFIGIVLGAIFGVFLSVYINEIIAIIEFILNNIILFYSNTEIKLFNPELYLDRIPVRIEWDVVLFQSIFAFFICTLSSIIPALLATSKKPIDILKKI